MNSPLCKKKKYMDCWFQPRKASIVLPALLNDNWCLTYCEFYLASEPNQASDSSSTVFLLDYCHLWANLGTHFFWLFMLFFLLICFHFWDLSKNNSNIQFKPFFLTRRWEGSFSCVNIHINRQKHQTGPSLLFLYFYSQVKNNLPFNYHPSLAKKMNGLMTEWRKCWMKHRVLPSTWLRLSDLKLLLLKNIFLCFPLQTRTAAKVNLEKGGKNTYILTSAPSEGSDKKRKKKTRLCTSSDASVMQSGAKAASVCHQKYCKTARRKTMWNKRRKDAKRTAPT